MLVRHIALALAGASFVSVGALASVAGDTATPNTSTTPTAPTTSTSPNTPTTAPPKPTVMPAPRATWNLKCNVASGGDQEFPNDIVLTNSGPGPVPTGAKVHWSLGNDSGDYTFTAVLANGASKQLDNVLSSGAGPGSACTVVKK